MSEDVGPVLETDAFILEGLPSSIAPPAPDGSVLVRILYYLTVLAVCVAVVTALWLSSVHSQCSFSSPAVLSPPSSPSPTPCPSCSAPGSVQATPAASSSPAVHALHPLYERYAPICEAANVNVVKPRGDGQGRASDASLARPWSVHPHTFTLHSEPCNRTEDLLQSVAWGRRLEVVPQNGSHPGWHIDYTSERDDKEFAQSAFVPFGCQPRWYSGATACPVLNKYAHVIFVGDSLMRHLSQALMILLTEDLQYGAIPRLSRQPGLFDSCRCDGQFSEHSLCRAFEDANMFWQPDPRSYGLCTHAAAFDFTFHFVQLHVWDMVVEERLCSADHRPRLAVLQSATHMGADATAVYSHVIEPWLDRLYNITARCPHPIQWQMIWMAAPAQSRSLDIRYPNQSGEKMAAFNSLIAAKLLQRPNVTILEIWNHSLNAATSDGFHYLTDVNIHKASILLHLLDLLQLQ